MPGKRFLQEPVSISVGPAKRIFIGGLETASEERKLKRGKKLRVWGRTGRNLSACRGSVSWRSLPAWVDLANSPSVLA